MNMDSLVREIGRVDYPGLLEVGARLVELVQPGAVMQVSSAAGTQLEVMNGPDLATHDGEYAQQPGACVSPPGLVTWTPDEASMQGTIVVDGTIWPPDELGRLHGRVVLTVASGQIVGIEGDYDLSWVLF
jgi:leucyl aminopeptidase (aminopeptidase T)